MKIGILTQPLHTNYGGILQNYALQTVLKSMGHEPVTINRDWNRGLRYKFIVILKRFILRYIFGRKDISPIIPYWEIEAVKSIIRQNTDIFIRNEIVLTKRMTSSLDLKEIENNNFEVFIVGSDQVWRPRYSPRISTYFLDFLQKDNTVKKIAYAASFGVDDWEFSSKETKTAQRLIKQFDAISVREDSALKLCRDYLKVEAKHVLDPTMLLNREDYIGLVGKNQTIQSQGNMFVYVLDKNKEKEDVVKKISSKMKLQPFEIMPKEMIGKDVDINDCVFPSVYQWIRSFMDAEFIVTDSFHGTVFSLIFNKPFLAIGNAGRGLTRFTSLLKMFNLENRLILSIKELTEEKINNNIDFNRVNTTLQNYQHYSFSFLGKKLNE